MPIAYIHDISYITTSLAPSFPQRHTRKEDRREMLTQVEPEEAHEPQDYGDSNGREEQLGVV